MSILKKINKFCGIISLLTFAAMGANVVITRNPQGDMLFYYCCAAFLIFGSIFLFTAAIFVLYNLIRSIRRKQFGRLIKHYLYAVFACYIICMLFSYIIYGSIYMPSYFLPSFIMAIIQIYFVGYKTAAQPKAAD